MTAKTNATTNAQRPTLLELEQETQLVQLLEIGELLGTVHASLVPDCLPHRMTLLIAILIG